MTNSDQVARDYLAVWNEADATKRRVRLSEGWSVDARYVDPLMTGDGHDGIAKMIETARAGFPGHSFALRGSPDGHGGFARFSWTLAPADGAPVAGGTDVVRLDEHGRIAEVVGFLDGTAT